MNLQRWKTDLQLFTAWGSEERWKQKGTSWAPHSRNDPQPWTTHRVLFLTKTDHNGKLERSNMHTKLHKTFIMNAGQSPLVKGACLLTCVWSPESTKEMEGKHGVHVIFYDLHKRAWHAGGPTPTRSSHTHIQTQTQAHDRNVCSLSFALCVRVHAHTHAQGEGSTNQMSSLIAWCLILNKSLTEARVHWFGQTSLLASLRNPPVSRSPGITAYESSTQLQLSLLFPSPHLSWDKNPLGSTGWWGCPNDPAASASRVLALYTCAIQHSLDSF